MITYASISSTEAFLFTQYGEDLARKFFGATVDTMPRYVRGKHVGRLKGKIVFYRVARGGWVREGEAGCGHVERRVGQIIRAELCTAPYMEAHKVLHTWDADNSFMVEFGGGIK